jgi:adenylate cyclase class 2
MKFEVEQKHRVDDPGALMRRLAERNVTLGPPQIESDQYFDHPCRHFAQTDEALRIRTIGSRSFVTYKGPKLDETTKTRRELELPLPTGDDPDADFAVLLEALGFKAVATVRKERRPFQIAHSGRDVHGAYDVVGGIGEFIELELTADERGIDEAKRVIASLALELDLGSSVRQSYLELLLSSRA